MVGASIYGFVDYKKTIHNKEFRNLYNEKEVKDQTITTHQAAIKPEPKVPVTEEKPVKEKDQLIKKSESTQNKLPVKKINKNKKEEKKMSYKLFSRAPLDRRYIDKELKLDELNKSEPGIRTDSLRKN